MDLNLLDKDKKQVAVERLTALWALNEAGLGGLLHAVQLPFKGILIGGIAVIIISLIGYIAEDKFKSILKATLIVLIIKLFVSPYTPLTAYFAVCFQGITGALIFRVFSNFRLSAMLLAVLAFAESSLQRLIVLTLIFGNPLWESVDSFFDYVLRETGLMSAGGAALASKWLVGGYLFIYLVFGILVGFFSGNFPSQLRGIPEDKWTVEPVFQDTGLVKKSKPRWINRKVVFLVILFFITLTLFFITPDKSWTRGFYVIIRSVLIIGVWFLLISPALTKLFIKYLNRQRSRYSQDVEQVLLSLPLLRKTVQKAWRESGNTEGMRRIKFFLISLINHVLTEENY